MLTAEIRVNGAMVGIVYAHNSGYLSTDDFDTCVYHYNVIPVPYTSEKFNDKQVSGTVFHDRTEGFVKLFKIIMNAADLEKGD